MKGCAKATTSTSKTNLFLNSDGVRTSGMFGSTGQTLDEYKEGVFANPDAMKVKMADLRHNTDIRRLKGVTEKDITRMAKYHTFYMELKAKLSA